VHGAGLSETSESVFDAGTRVACRAKLGTSRASRSRASTPAQQPLTAALSKADFAVLPDRKFLELVRPAGAGEHETQFLYWDGESAQIVDRFENKGRILIPPQLDGYEMFNLRLPTGVQPCGAGAELFLEISKLIRSRVDISENSSSLVAAFVLSTWLNGLMDVAPYLWICGPRESGKTTLLRLLHRLCRRAVLFAGSIPPAMHSLNPLFHPTLLLDEVTFDRSQQSRALQAWLRAGNSRGVPVTIGGQLVDGFGPKVVCSRLPVADPSLASRGLHIYMAPAIKTVDVLSDRELEEIAADFQSRLMMFRFHRYDQYKDRAHQFLHKMNLQVRGKRLQALTSVLQVAAVCDPRPYCDKHEVAHQQLKAALMAHDGVVIQDRTDELESLVVEVLLKVCHRKDCPAHVLVGVIAGFLNKKRKQAGEAHDVSARAVGESVRSLGFPTRTINGYGRGMDVTASAKDRIHALMVPFGALVFVPGCSRCDQIRLHLRGSGPEAPKADSADKPAVPGPS
jgi:hypothetical protein